MRYLELKIQASEQGVEQITALLLGMGITEMSIDDPHDMDDILQKKHEYGWDYIEDDLKENLDREPVISLYFDEADPKAQQMAVMVKGGISALQRRQQAGEFGQQADLGSLTVTENIVDDGDWKDKWKEFFKPTKVTDRIVVKPTWEEYTPKEDELVIEEYVKGREFSVGVIDFQALPIIEIAPVEGFYDYKNKYKAGSTVETCPAELSEQITKEMQGYAEKVAEVLGLNTYSRTDFLLDAEDHIFCLEANTLPGMTPTSLLPQEAKVTGVDFNQLCEKLIESSMRKYKN